MNIFTSFSHKIVLIYKKKILNNHKDSFFCSKFNNKIKVKQTFCFT